MPTLYQSLQNQDFGQLHIIAEFWDISLQAPDERQGRKELAEKILKNKTLVREVIEDLPTEAQLALTALLGKEGKIPLHLFTQQHGEIREMGPGRRDREKPFLNPISAAERLWYFGLISRAFFDTDDGPQEFAYIPEDLLALLPGFLHTQLSETPLSRPATPAERAYKLPANHHILDNATTLLAALRMEMDSSKIQVIGSDWPMDVVTLTSLLQTAGLLSEENTPLAEPVRAFLEASRAEALAQLATAWLASETHDDLRLIPHLTAEGEWQNDPLKMRQTSLKILLSLGEDTWWSLPALVSSLKKHQPNFLRPHGDYDSWYLKDNQEGHYLRGFKYWDQVEGAYLQYLVRGPFHWLGLMDLAASQAGAPITVFRFSRWAKDLLESKPPAINYQEDETPTLNSQGEIIVPHRTPRAIRYLVARFCEWGPVKGGFYTYSLTPKSLTRAGRQGLKIRHLLNLLQRASDTPLPPNILKALDRWQEQGTQITFQKTVVLRVNSPEMLQALLDSPAKRFLGTPLGPTTITVNQGALQKVRDILMRLGYLSEADQSLNNDDV